MKEIIYEKNQCQWFSKTSEEIIIKGDYPISTYARDSERNTESWCTSGIWKYDGLFYYGSIQLIRNSNWDDEYNLSPDYVFDTESEALDYWDSLQEED